MSQHTHAHTQTHARVWIHPCMSIHLRKAAPSVLVLSGFCPPYTHSRLLSFFHSYFSLSSLFFLHTHPSRSLSLSLLSCAYRNVIHSLFSPHGCRTGKRGVPGPPLTFDCFIAPIQFKVWEIEGDNSHRNAERDKTVITGIETMVSESSSEIKLQIISL